MISTCLMENLSKTTKDRIYPTNTAPVNQVNCEAIAVISTSKCVAALGIINPIVVTRPEIMNVASRQMASSWVLFRVMVISPSLSVMSETVYLFMGNNAGE